MDIIQTQTSVPISFRWNDEEGKCMFCDSCNETSLAFFFSMSLLSKVTIFDRENDASTSCVTTFGRAEVANGPSAKRRRHFEDET